jgi:hypothetical protein
MANAISREFRSSPDHPDVVCGVFVRKSPKAAAKLKALLTGGLLAALVYQKELAKELNLPLRKVELVAYWAKPSTTPSVRKEHEK